MSRRRFPKSESPPEEAFGKRLTHACDNHPECPPLHHGRLVWMVENLKKRFDATISTEAARKWLAGEGLPRPRRISMLAELLLVDEAWLSIGDKSDDAADHRSARNATAGGSVNLIAGLIELHGGRVAFPEPDSKNAKDTDIIAIIKGASYNFKIALGHSSGGKSFIFQIPPGYRDVFVLGLAEVGPLHWDVLELDTDTITKHKQNKGGYVEITATRRGSSYSVAGDRLRQLSGFRERP
jgi:hypothetical protein